jgi:hypothetical protein
MNIPNVGPVPAAPASTGSLESKRAALQAALLRKSVESQQQHADQIQREAEGKGQIVDLRV